MKHNRKNAKSNKNKQNDKQNGTSFRQLISQYQSYTPDEGVSQLSNNQQSPLQLQVVQVSAEQFPLYKFHRQTLTIKHKIIKILCFLFYSVEQCALVNYMCQVLMDKFKTDIGKIFTTSDRYVDHQYRVKPDMEQMLFVKKQDLSLKFYQAEKIIGAVKQTKMFMDKQGDAAALKVNDKFFNMLTSICEDLLKKTESQEKQFTGTGKVLCKGCGEERLQFQIEAKIKCKCGSIQRAPHTLNHSNNQTLQSIKALNTQIKKVLQWKAQIDELGRKEVQRITLERNKNIENFRVTDADKDILKAKQYIEKQVSNVNNYVSPWEKYPLKKNGVHLRNAENEFAPKRQYSKIKELKELGATRKRKKTEHDRYNPQSH